MKCKVFYDGAREINERVNRWLKENRTIKINHVVQSQSQTVLSSADECGLDPDVVLTVFYTDEIPF